MKVIVLQTIAYHPPDMELVPAHVAEECRTADLVIAVYQNTQGDGQAAVMRSNDEFTQVAIHDVV